MIKNIELKGNSVLVTFDRVSYKKPGKSGLFIDKLGAVKSIQKVFRVGDQVNAYQEGMQIHEGDLVYVDLSQYLERVPKHSYDNPAQAAWSSKSKEYDIAYIGDTLDINGTTYALIDAMNIVGRVEVEEDE